MRGLLFFKEASAFGKWRAKTLKPNSLSKLHLHLVLLLCFKKSGNFKFYGLGSAEKKPHFAQNRLPV